MPKRYRYFAMLLLFLASMLAVTGLPTAYTQLTSDPYALSYNAFGRLEKIYEGGGEAPRLVAELNSALDLLHTASTDQVQGNSTGATQAEQQAGNMLQQVLNQAPAAGQEARANSLNTLLLVSVLAVLAIVAATGIFIVTLNFWRWYDREKLLGMVIVEDESPKD